MDLSIIKLTRLSISLIGLSLLASVALADIPVNCDQSSHDQQIRFLATNKDIYENKVYGAWFGKLIGLIAGQPVEGGTRQNIEAIARRLDAYPIRWYFPPSYENFKPFLRGNFTSSPSNDDSDFLVVSLLALREHGINLTSKNIAEAWVKYSSGGCTAEGVALANFNKGIWPPESATTENPYSEWIGAQMRADIWGMIAPGLPGVAADYAERDAKISHTGNGIYAERYIAAVISLAMVETDCKKILQDALDVIPADCRYANAVKDVIKWHDQCATWGEAWDLMDAKYGFLKDGSRTAQFAEKKYLTGLYANWCDMKWVYADINGASVALALLYGDGDFTKTVGIAVMSGYDCDCNAGTVGAILGAMWGEKAIPTKWKAPLNDTYNTSVKVDNKSLKISALAEETARYGLKVLASKK
ncbi:MAG: ADP-ribosylglycohydrolase family protein [Armatimonadota bacterium]|nr:ADP-ribosylglycohydrolase family protein [bacterium]